MQFPDDNTLLARGKYTTLSSERKKQLERVRVACQTMMTSTQRVLRDCEERPPQNMDDILLIGRCLENIKTAREVIVGLCNDMADLETEAWE